MPQRPGLISGTVAENVALGVPAENIDLMRVAQVLKDADLEEFVNKEELNMLLGAAERGLSGGQLQRLGLARALYSRPRLLILDEATSALDAASEHRVSAALRKLRGQVTVMLVAHRLSTVRQADRVFVLEQGQLLASGTFERLAKEIPLVAQYVQLGDLEMGGN